MSKTPRIRAARVADRRDRVLGRGLRAHVPDVNAPATVGPGTSRKKPARPAGESFLAHPAHALWAAGGMLALVVLIAILVPEGPLGVDRSWAQAMHHLETPLLTDLALAFNWLGRGLGRALGLTLVGLLLLRRRRWLALAAFAFAVLAPAADPPSPPAMPPTPARPAWRSSCSSPHLACAADGGGRSRASELSAWPGVARTSRCTGSPTSSPERSLAAASRCSCSPSPSGTNRGRAAPRSHGCAKRGERRLPARNTNRHP